MEDHDVDRCRSLTRRAFLRRSLAGASLGVCDAVRRVGANEEDGRPRVRIGLVTDLHYADKPAAGQEQLGFDESQTGDSLIVENERLYGHHGHFSSASSMLFFGGGFKQGFVYGKTADRHPMLPIEKPVHLIDAYATIYKALGIPADTFYVIEERPFYVTNNGKGKVIEELLA